MINRGYLVAGNSLPTRGFTVTLLPVLSSASHGCIVVKGCATTNVGVAKVGVANIGVAKVTAGWRILDEWLLATNLGVAHYIMSVCGNRYARACRVDEKNGRCLEIRRKTTACG